MATRKSIRFKYDADGAPVRVAFPRFLFRYLPIDDRLFTAIKDGYLWFSSPADFNDPFEMRPTFDESIPPEDIEAYFTYLFSNHTSQEEAEKNARRLVAMTGDSGKSIWSAATRALNAMHADMLAFCCFSTVCDNTLMWSHYARGHTGACLVYDFADLALSGKFAAIEVEYFKQIPLFNYARAVAEVGSYGRDRLYDQAVLGRKSAEWAYEREIRLLARYKGKNSIPEGSLRGAIFGAKAKADEVEAVRAQMEAHLDKPAFDFAKLDHETHKVVVEHGRNYTVRRKLSGFTRIHRTPPVRAALRPSG